MRNFTLLFCLIFCFVACQPNAEDANQADEITESTQQSDIEESTANTNNGGLSAYDLSTFTCMIEGKEWKPDLAFARVYYSTKNDLDSIHIKGSRVEDNSEMTISIFMFNGAGTYELKNDEATGKGIGMAEFKIEEKMQSKEFYSIGGKVTISNFNDTNGTIAGTIDGIQFFRRGEAMPEEREATGVFNGQRIEQ